MFKNVSSVSLHPRTADLIGMQFSRLKVIDFYGYRAVGKFSSAFWWCLCECGTEKKVQARFLKNGLTKSCGCIQRERASELNSKPPGVAGFNKIHRSYVYGAQNRGYSWELSEDDVKRLFESSCHYCGKAPSQESGYSSIYLHSGIDRIDNDKGYDVANCVSCCSICNYAKRDMSHDDFIAWAERVYCHQKGQGASHL